MNTAGARNQASFSPRKPPRQRWIVAEPQPEAAAALAKEARLPQVLAELLLARGVTGSAQAHAFLNPGVAHLHDPFLMLGMTEAVERLERAIAAREPVLLYGDYDVDGTAAVVLLKTAIEMRGGVTRFHVPHRLREGYGVQSSVLQAAHAGGVRLVITVDTGMRAFAEAETARSLGMDLIVTDHHLPERGAPMDRSSSMGCERGAPMDRSSSMGCERGAPADRSSSVGCKRGDALPAALAILNPNQPGCPYPEKALCGAAIALKLAQALLERRDPVRTREKTLPSFLKLAAIATIADAVPLRGENRAIAAIGLRELRRPVGAGLRALFAAAALDPAAKQLTGFDVAFRLAPRINAAGRMDVASEVIELFSTRDVLRAAELANKLERLNRERRDTESAALAAIEARLEADAELAAERLLVVDGDGWHRGVIGILASRVVERTAKPAIVVSVDDGVAHGSGRSVDGFALLDAIEGCADLFTRFGGHAFAVGFAMPAGNLPELKRRLRLYAEEHLAAREPERLLRIHAELPLDRITPVLVGWLRKLEPLGHGNPEPVFVARRARLLASPRVMKERHIRLDLAQEPDPASARQYHRSPVLPGSSGATRAVGWGLAGQAVDLGLAEGSRIDVAYRIRENGDAEYGGLEVEIVGMKAADS